MFKKETLNKVINKAKELKAHYMNINAEDIPMCISDGNKKIGHVLNVSLMPIMTCKNCGKCKHLCYDVKACIQYKNVIDARVRNTVLLEKNRDEYFRRIYNKCLRRRKNKYFRWHVAGDIVDFDYFARMVELAKEMVEFVFWTYTKNYEVVNEYCDKYGKDSIPDNLHIIFSEWRGMEMVNLYHFPEFRVVFKDEEEPKGFYCPGNCDVCKEIKRGCLVGETTYCKEH